MRVDSDFYRNLLDSLSEGVYFIDQFGRITYWNDGAQKLCGYAGPDALGRGCSEGVLMCVDDNGVSLCEQSCPMVKAFESGSPHTEDVYILHRDGFRIPVSIRIAPIRGADGQIVGGSGILRDNSTGVAALKKAEELERVAYIDPVTGLASNSYISISLRARLDEMPRYGWTFAVLLVGIDDYGQLKLTQEAETMNRILRMVSQTLVRSVRSFDIVGRWHEGQFGCIMVNVRHKHQLSSIANRFRALVEQSTMQVGANRVHVTVSIGATVARPDDTPPRLMNRAGKLLGRNRVLGWNRVYMDPDIH